jgi:hypothetical protein
VDKSYDELLPQETPLRPDLGTSGPVEYLNGPHARRSYAGIDGMALTAEAVLVPFMLERVGELPDAWKTKLRAPCSIAQYYCLAPGPPRREQTRMTDCWQSL